MIVKEVQFRPIYGCPGEECSGESPVRSRLNVLDFLGLWGVRLNTLLGTEPLSLGAHLDLGIGLAIYKAPIS